MNKSILLIILVLVVMGGFVLFYDTETTDNGMQNTENTTGEMVSVGNVSVTPLSHATMALSFGDVVVYVDPVGDVAQYSQLLDPTIVLVTDIHGDHLNIDTLSSVLAENSVLIAPQAVVDELPEELASRVTVLANGDTTESNGLVIEALPMYNLPEDDPESRHIKGRGNGYVITSSDTRVYIAGDTDGIQEMRSLTDIDIAFVPMNPPYTMDVAEAADAVLDFAPAQVYPYHYRTPEGFSDINEFERLVNEGNPDIEVVRGQWYPDAS